MPERPRPRGGGGARALHLRGARALIAAKLGEPSHDPHGTPIPGPDLLPPAGEEGRGEAGLAAAERRKRRSRASFPARPGSPRPPAARSTATASGIGRLWPFLGPAFVAAVAYIDPGNFATNIAGGAKFGYLLLWVVLAANLVAMLVQTQSAKLGIATGKNLAELCRERFSRRTSDRPLAAGRAGGDGVRHRRGGRRRARAQPAVRHPALPGRDHRRRRRLRDPRPAAAGASAASRPGSPSSSASSSPPSPSSSSTPARERAKSASTSSSPASPAPRASCSPPGSSARR